MSTTAVLVNPARVSNLRSLRRTVLETLAHEGWPEPAWLQTTTQATGESQARHAISDGATVLFVCGGDGTVMAAAAALSGSETALAVIPSGTGNVLALNLGLPTDVSSAVRLAVSGGRRRIDLGEVDGRVFTVAAGVGLDALVLADTPHLVKHRVGWPAYVAAGLRHLGEPQFAAQLSLDGGEPFVRQVRSILVANVGRLPGGITLLPSAVPDDGLLDVAVIAPGRLRDWARLWRSLVGRHPKGGRIETFRASRIEINTDSSQPREIDGDPLPPGLALVVGVRPAALMVCVPQHVAGPGRKR
ncbi:MAG: diacylglycerol kinase family protein [Candidatus Dormiibacterota bacterium]